MSSLAKKQERELAKIFLDQLDNKNIKKEFREYTRLFKKIGIDPYREQIKTYAQANKQYIREAAQRLLL